MPKPSRHKVANWCSKVKRYAIYARDSYSCLWCLCKVVAGETATLDHYVAKSRGGSNSHDNLFTACHRCNSERRDQGAELFAFLVALRPGRIGSGRRARRILKRIERSLARPVKTAHRIKEAKRRIERLSRALAAQARRKVA